MVAAAGLAGITLLLVEREFMSLSLFAAIVTTVVFFFPLPELASTSMSASSLEDWHDKTFSFLFLPPASSIFSRVRAGTIRGVTTVELGLCLGLEPYMEFLLQRN